MAFIILVRFLDFLDTICLLRSAGGKWALSGRWTRSTTWIPALPPIRRQ